MYESVKEEILKIAREAIVHYLKGERYSPSVSHPLLIRKGACFVTLRKNNELRGCIGSLIATRPLYEDIIENAINAAFFDPRFPPLQEDELKEIKIEVSILTPMKKVEIKSVEELFKKIIPRKHGVYIRKGPFSATFLPQVWEELKEPAIFFTYLCMKAGMNGNCWRHPEKLEIYVYEVEAYEEE